MRGQILSLPGKPQISLWDAIRRICQARFEPGSPPVTQGQSAARVAISADGNAIVVTSYRERAITMIDLPTKETRWSVSLSHDMPNTPAVSADGRIIAVGTEQGLIMLLDAETGERIREPLRHGEKPLQAVAFSSENTLASTGHDGIVKLWDLESFEGVALPRAHREKTSSAAFSPDGHLLVTAGGCLMYDQDPWTHQGEVCVWDVPNRKLLVKFHAHYGSVTRAVFSPSGKWLATTGRDGKMRLWEVAEVLKKTAGTNDVKTTGRVSIYSRSRSSSHGTGIRTERLSSGLAYNM